MRVIITSWRWALFSIFSIFIRMQPDDSRSVRNSVCVRRMQYLIESKRIARLNDNVRMREFIINGGFLYCRTEHHKLNILCFGNWILFLLSFGKWRSVGSARSCWGTQTQRRGERRAYTSFTASPRPRTQPVRRAQLCLCLRSAVAAAGSAHFTRLAETNEHNNSFSCCQRKNTIYGGMSPQTRTHIRFLLN